ncbi:bifunctional UDP-N-acetylglucosamine diphosphorylase/glucosamine-1-phosphate N-acetyltransferase GlmU [Aeromicrobium halocynthiae]|uniref:bifunctional UDP-N-acetylglucosamine diphosphorylase/glucosamine-1-phosphate N-acetyltransferase GlmU n=1 Tax=Aeromicrobium halocynthiae TaxID=560557 RepID=UPI0031E328D5
MSSPLTVIVLAAGAGTRMKSRRAKVLHEIGGRSLLAHSLQAVRGLGATRIVAVVGHQREQVSAALAETAPDVEVVVQEEQRGTGHAVAVALQALPAPTPQGPGGGTVLVTYADVPLLSTDTLTTLLLDHRGADRAVTILSARPEDPSGYGRIVRDEDGAVLAIREHKDADATELAITETNSGILAVDEAFLRHAVSRLDSDNAQGELYLTDIVAKAVAEGRRVGAQVLADHWQAEGVNDRRQLAALGAELNWRTVVRWMDQGVTMVDPCSVWIDVGVELAPDVTVLPGTQLLGATTVDEGATIGPDTTLRDVRVGADASVVRTHGSDAVVGPGASVGPFAYLRPGATLGDSAKVGTFVEVKNSTLGDGAKVPHLSYVGDADVGEGSNIGAGTIVANYDGTAKHRTVVGRHARTGSDNVFVAPVEIGDGAYTGAGTIVREDVPPGALAVTAGEQRTMEGWVQRRRPGTPSAQAVEDRGEEPAGE